MKSLFHIMIYKELKNIYIVQSTVPKSVAIHLLYLSLFFFFEKKGAFRNYNFYFFSEKLV